MSFSTFQARLCFISVLVLFSCLAAAKTPSPTFIRSEFRPSFSSSEMEALNCHTDLTTDSEARFAIQYQSERESLEITEFGHLQMNQRLQPCQGGMIALVSKQRRHSDYPPAFILA